MSYIFCPHCLEDHVMDEEDNSCDNCGVVIPDGIIELEEARDEAILMSKRILEHLDFFEDVVENKELSKHIRDIVNDFLGDEK